MIRTSRSAAVATALAAATAAVLVTSPGASAEELGGLRAVGLAGGGTELVAFRTDEPERARMLGPFSGLDGDEFLIGIDFRPATGRLYGVGDAGGVYLVDDRTADATKVGALSVALDGEHFGLDVCTVLGARARLLTKLHRAQLNASRVEQVRNRHIQRLSERH